VELPSKSELLVELPMRFRNAVWVRRGGFVLIATEGFTDGKVGGEIVQVIMDEKAWRKLEYWCASSILLLILGPMSSKERRKVARTRIRWKSQKLDVMLLLREGME
jgi:probable RNA-binding protein EIF1AD